ncbi:MAG: hypothetical protein AVDCRST_MAG35-2591 [uncultured Quadrisphaera sp.]|uniref:DUF1206 domain-containing protein n=1 Tax=uncultured Quadrisphaera sp. TaxID=904978 RepID=A0A6J4Q511_9ACTN|nr:MAG: hypothetical protein AVDCRST_MAG35-2591 [uncultured Quadrisphaera sp.]
MIGGVDTAVEQRLQAVGRVGYLVSGALHVIIGALAVQVALGVGGGSGQRADQTGALASIAAQPFGAALLWFAVVALAGLGLWQLWQALEAARPGRRSPASGSGGSERDAGAAAKAAGKGVVYLVLAATAAGVARGGSGSGGQGDVTASLLASTPGRLLVGAVGLAVVAVGAYHVHSGITQKFLRNLRGLPPGRAGRGARTAGRVGYVAKGAALAVLGGLFVLAAVRADPQQAGGLDQALRTIGEQPFGQVLLVAVGAGFVAFGIFCAVRARYARN